MLVRIVVFLIVAQVCAQEQELTTVPPSQLPPFPFLDLFTGASNYYPDRKTGFSEPIAYHGGCPKTDSLSSLANLLGSAAKIMLSGAVIILLKFLVGKLLLFPVTVVLLAKLGLKVALLWPVLSKIVKYFKKKKSRKDYNGRTIIDCSQRFACVIQKSSEEGWLSSLGASTTFYMVDDIDEESSLARAMLTVLSSENVAQCMAMDCISGVDIS